MDRIIKEQNNFEYKSRKNKFVFEEGKERIKNKFEFKKEEEKERIKNMDGFNFVEMLQNENDGQN